MIGLKLLSEKDYRQGGAKHRNQMQIAASSIAADEFYTSIVENISQNPCDQRDIKNRPDRLYI